MKLLGGLAFSLALLLVAQAPARPEVASQGEGEYVIRESFDVPASSAAVWKVLTDYDGMHRFISSIERSGKKGARNGSVIIEQRSVGRVLFVKKRIYVLLEVREEPFRSIEFKDIDGRDFKFYAGSWQIEEQKGSARVSYALEAEPNFAALWFVTKKAMTRIVQDLMEELRQEILRRAGQPL